MSTRRATESPSPHVPAIDGVRGCAILLVMAYHFASSLHVLGVDMPGRAVLQLGWCGVDVFFALSGFLITGILLDTRDTPGYFRNFYARRALRIFPLYYGSLLAVLLLSGALPGAEVWGLRDGLAAPGSLLWPALFLENVAILLHGASETGVTTHDWSLAVEEHFYLAWPLAVWLLSRRRVMGAALLLGSLSIAGRAAVLWSGMDIDAAFGLTPLRLDGLAIGAVAACLVRGRAGAKRALGPALAVLWIAGAALVAMLALRHTTHQSDRLLWLAAYPLVSACTAAILVVCLSGGRLAALMAARPLRWFGRYSFGLYVWHPIVGMLLFHSRFALVTAQDGPGHIVAAALFVLALDLAVAWVSFHLWEKPFLDLKARFPAAGPRSPAPVLTRRA